MTLVAAPTYVQAEDVGSCRMECHDSNRVGVRLNVTTQSECQTSSQGCRAVWSAEPCPGPSAGPGVPAVPFGLGADESDESEDDPPAQR